MLDGALSIESSKNEGSGKSRRRNRVEHTILSAEVPWIVKLENQSAFDWK